MSRWIGLLGSWALLVLAVGLLVIGATAETMNVRESRQFRRIEFIDDLASARIAKEVTDLRQNRAAAAARVQSLRTKVAASDQQIDDLQDPGQVITVSTAENRVYLRRGNKVVFKAVCSTGKGTVLVDQGHTIVFNTPVGKFRIKSKEEHPTWVPPDWYYVEEARKNGMRVVHLNRGDRIDADTGGPVRSSRGGGFWSVFGEDPSPGTREVMRVSGKNVVIDSGGTTRTLPAGHLITAGDAVIVPPIGTAPREYPDVLGVRRLNLGDGYALHGTNAEEQLGSSVSHGCVRLSNENIERLYDMVNVGDEVVIY